MSNTAAKVGDMSGPVTGRRRKRVDEANFCICRSGTTSDGIGMRGEAHPRRRSRLDRDLKIVSPVDTDRKST